MADQQNDRTQLGQSSGGASKPAGAAPSKSSPPNKAASTGGNLQSTGSSGNINSAASGILEQAKDTASETYDKVATKANSALEERKNAFSAGLKTVADSFRKTGTELGTTGEPNQLTDMTSKYTGTAAQKLDELAGYFERKDLRAMMRDAEGFARRNPAIFLGTAFAFGLLAARFLKSGRPNTASETTSGRFDTRLGQTLPSTDRPSTSLPPTV